MNIIFDLKKLIFKNIKLANLEEDKNKIKVSKIPIILFLLQFDIHYNSEVNITNYSFIKTNNGVRLNKLDNSNELNIHSLDEIINALNKLCNLTELELLNLLKNRYEYQNTKLEEEIFTPISKKQLEAMCKVIRTRWNYSNLISKVLKIESL